MKTYLDLEKEARNKKSWSELESEFKRSQFFNPGQSFDHPQKVLDQFIKFLKNKYPR